jgi:hypothetical protein
MTLLKILTSRFDQTANLGFGFATKRIFPGDFIYRESMHCTICQSEIASIQQSSFLILDVTAGSVETALGQYFGASAISSKCSYCGRVSNRLQSRQLLFLPRSILLFVNRRRELAGGVPSNREFAYPTAIDLGQYALGSRPVEPREGSGLMRVGLGGISEAVHRVEEGMKLASVVAFRGRDNAGHYFAYRLHRGRLPPFPQRWVCANDSRITETTLEDVLALRTSALLLTYEFPLGED